MTTPFLGVHDLSFGYGRGAATRPVLSQVSLEVTRGSVVGLLGPNGSGKTTLLRLMAGVLTPHGGDVRLDGQPIARLPRRELATRIAVVPQDTHATFDFTALEMVLMGRYPHLGPFAIEGPDDVRIAREAMASTGTLALEARMFDTLSGGEKQRIVIAAALAQSARVLLLDEPTSSLDLAYQLEIAALVLRLNRDRGVTIVLSTHDLNFAASVCRSLVLLRDGHVVASGPTADVLTPANIRAVYGVEADVTTHPAAHHLTVVPIRSVGARA